MSWCLRSRLARAALGVSCLALIAPASALATRATPGAVITNGAMMLGVTQLGDLGVSCPPPGQQGNTGCPAASPGGTSRVGVRFVPLNTEALGTGNESWGVGDAASGLAGGASELAGASNITAVSFLSTATSAVSTVDVSDPTIPGYSLRVVHDFHPSTISPNLYEVSVSITNTGPGDIGNLLFRRAAAWSIEPTAGSTWVTLAHGSAARGLAWDSDNGGVLPSPLSPRLASYSDSTYVCGTAYAGTCDVTDLGGTDGADPRYPGAFAGPANHGAAFDYAFGRLGAGQTRAFRLYYGAAPSEAIALAAIGAQGMGAYSLGEPGCQGSSGFARGGLCAGLAPYAGVELGQPDTFVLGFDTALADISVSPSAATASTTPGGLASTVYTVGNAGPDAAAGVHLTIPIPAGVAFVSAAPSAGSCAYVAPIVDCTLGSLAVAGSASVTLAVSGSTLGDSLVRATASTLASDPSHANDSAGVIVTVAAEPAPLAPAPPAPGTSPKSKHPAVRPTPAGRASTGARPLFVAASGRTLAVGCALTKGHVAICDVKLVARANGHDIVVGHGHGVFGRSAAHATVSVPVALTATGRALARTPGGLRTTVRSSIHPVGNSRTFRVQTTTRIVLPTLLVLSGDLLFDTDSAVVKPAALAYIGRLKGQIVGAKRLGCDGFTDTQGSTGHNMTLGLERATAVCALFSQGTAASTHSVSLGEARARATNDTVAGRALNRRVEIHVAY